MPTGLGDVCNNITIAKPLRDADVVSIDLNSVMSSYSANFEQFQPNGFNGKEICALSRYAGMSDKVSSFGIFKFFDQRRSSAYSTNSMVFYRRNTFSCKRIPFWK